MTDDGEQLRLPPRVFEYSNIVLERLRSAGAAYPSQTQATTGSSLRLAQTLRDAGAKLHVYETASNGRGDCGFSSWAKLLDFNENGAARVREGLANLLRGTYLPSERAGSHPAYPATYSDKKDIIIHFSAVTVRNFISR